MKINEQCLPCLMNQVIKIANMVNVDDKKTLYKQVFLYLSNLDFDKTNPEIIGETFDMLKKHIGNKDPYYKIRRKYNTLFLDKIDDFDQKIHSIEEAIKYAIVGNIIDFNPIHQKVEENIASYFKNIDQLSLTINHVEELMQDLKKARMVLYLGDNCGEICLDKLLIKRIYQYNPKIKIYFAVRGYPIVNDNIEEDAYFVKMDEYATIISNGDSSLGTVLHRTSQEFQDVYQKADVIISKGQANFESLSEARKKIYFLLMVKCAVIASYIQVPEKSLVCLKKRW